MSDEENKTADAVSNQDETLMDNSRYIGVSSSDGDAEQKPMKDETSAGGDGDEDEGEGTESEDTESDETSEDSGAGDEDDDAEDGGQDDEQDDGEQGDDEKSRPKKKKSFQERINDITRARRESERRAAELEEQLKELRSKMSEDPKDQGTEETAKGEPSPHDFKYGEVDPEYISALADYRVEKKLKEHEKSQAERAHAERQKAQAVEIQTKFNEALTEGQAKYKDFQDVVALAEAEAKFQMPAEIGAMIVSSKQRADIIYHLASDIDAASRIAGKTPLEQAKDIGRLEERFAKEESKPSRPVTKAPPPVPSAKGSSGVSTPDTSKMSAAEYLAHLQSKL